MGPMGPWHHKWLWLSQMGPMGPWARGIINGFGFGYSQFMIRPDSQPVTMGDVYPKYMGLSIDFITGIYRTSDPI